MLLAIIDIVTTTLLVIGIIIIIVVFSITAYRRRCIKANIGHNFCKYKSLYHYTTTKNLELICNHDNHYVIKGSFRLSNIVNYLNVLFKVKNKPLIFFFADEPTEQQLRVNIGKGPFCSIIINIDKACNLLKTKELYYRHQDNVVIVVSNELFLDEHMICFGSKKIGRLDIMTALNLFFGKRI